ncbi:MAG: 3-deoxy-manno-octulosonate cytidylyltransferase [Chitinophagaceae bacterium]|nr:3-deoxy-manno-octulosonate cytidylyltransferase [Chitinophagaceae bacterium]
MQKYFFEKEKEKTILHLCSIMKATALIPARYAATRFPAKLMQMLGNKTVIRHTYDNTVATGLFDDVIVATDSKIIFDEIVNNGGKAVMSARTHESGSDRIAEAVAGIETDIAVNIQGDEPFVKREPLQRLLQVFEGEEGKAVQVASLMQVLKEPELIQNPNYVKVVIDKKMNALLFTRAAAPYHRNKDAAPCYYEHIGVYAFRKKALMDFTTWEATPLENIEKIECLRYLENGVPLKMVVVDYMGIEIDTPEDLIKAEQYL